MSAFICDEYHISALAVYATRARQPNYLYHNGECIYLDNDQQIAQVLYDQNLRSVNARYNEQTDAAFTFDRMAAYLIDRHTPVEMIKAAHCYDYQACETEDYRDTLAHAIIKYIISKAIRALPGYEKAEWGLTNPDERMAARRCEIAAQLHQD